MVSVVLFFSLKVPNRRGDIFFFFFKLKHRKFTKKGEGKGVGVQYNIDTEDVRGMDRIGLWNRNLFLKKKEKKERKAERMARISEQLFPRPQHPPLKTENDEKIKTNPE